MSALPVYETRQGRKGMRSVRVVGLGGSLREMSTSRTALQVALEGAAASGADVELIWVRDLGLPLYTGEHAPPPGAHRLAETVYQADALIWSSPTYHGSVSGSFKNALDWMRRGLVELEPRRGWLQPRPRGRPAPHRPSPRPSAYARP
jgi:NAD(P)H-dependent FMN reductase